MCIVNPRTGKVKKKRIFDTFENSDGIEKWFSTVVQDYIVVCACRDECTKRFLWEGRKWFCQMGSKDVKNIIYKGGWAFIGLFARKG